MAITPEQARAELERRKKLKSVSPEQARAELERRKAQKPFYEKGLETVKSAYVDPIKDALSIVQPSVVGVGVDPMNILTKSPEQVGQGVKGALTTPLNIVTSPIGVPFAFTFGATGINEQIGKLIQKIPPQYRGTATLALELASTIMGGKGTAKGAKGTATKISPEAQLAIKEGIPFSPEAEALRQGKSIKGVEKQIEQLYPDRVKNIRESQKLALEEGLSKKSYEIMPSEYADIGSEIARRARETRTKAGEAYQTAKSMSEGLKSDIPIGNNASSGVYEVLLKDKVPYNAKGEVDWTLRQGGDIPNDIIADIDGFAKKIDKIKDPYTLYEEAQQFQNKMDSAAKKQGGERIGKEDFYIEQVVNKTKEMAIDEITKINPEAGKVLKEANKMWAETEKLVKKGFGKKQFEEVPPESIYSRYYNQGVEGIKDMKKLYGADNTADAVLFDIITKNKKAGGISWEGVKKTINSPTYKTRIKEALGDKLFNEIDKYADMALFVEKPQAFRGTQKTGGSQTAALLAIGKEINPIEQGLNTLKRVLNFTKTPSFLTKQVKGKNLFDKPVYTAGSALYTAGQITEDQYREQRKKLTKFREVKR